MGIVLPKLDTAPRERPDRLDRIGASERRKVNGRITETENLAVEIARRRGTHALSQYGNFLDRGGRSILLQMVRILHGCIVFGAAIGAVTCRTLACPALRHVFHIACAHKYTNFPTQKASATHKKIPACSMQAGKSLSADHSVVRDVTWFRT